jgi:hypothetical protein
MARSVVGLFEDRAAADETVIELIDRGIPQYAIRAMTKPPAAKPAEGDAERLDLGGGVPEEEAEAYWEGMRRGLVLVAVPAADDRASEVAEVVNRHRALDLDRQVSEWIAAGWARPLTRAAGRGGGSEQDPRRQYEPGGGARVFPW